MSLKCLKDNLLLCALLLGMYLFLKDLFPLCSLVLFILYFYSRCDLAGAAVLLLLCLCLHIPLSDMREIKFSEARIVDVHQNYAIAQSGLTKIMLYTDVPAPFDAKITLDGKFSRIESQKSFFGFDFAEYMKRKGVYYRYEGESFTIAGEHFTPRRLLQKKTEEIEDPLVKAFVYKTVFNISDDTMISGNFLLQGGFSFAGIMMIIDQILSYVLKEKTRTYLLIGINILMILCYGLHILLISMLIRRILRLLCDSAEVRSGIWIIAMILLFRKQILSAAFLFPLCFSLIKGKTADDQLIRYTLLFSAQSFLNQKVNPFDSLFYPFLIRIYGLFWFYGILIILIPNAALIDLIAAINRLSLISDRFCLYGSMIGFGLPFFLIWIFSFYRNRHFAKIAFGSLCIFFLCGLFHPFAEVSFINVGQGDCILIKGPLLSDNVLIDTGKPSQYANVCAALHARGIHHLHTFFVTHMDSDHCGSMDQIAKDFKVDRTITEHEGTTVSSYLVFHDLNSLKTEDENQSSLVLAFELNGLRFVMCGDADQISEEAIVRKFGNLKCDVLKLSHHGSKTGSCDLFLDTLKPQLGIVSSGAYSIYHHPSPETIQRLLSRHIPYLDTKDHGDISLFMIGPFCLLLCADMTFELLCVGPLW